MDTTISIYLDTRRIKDDGLYPVKLRVYSNALRKAKIYSLEQTIEEEEKKLIRDQNVQLIKEKESSLIITDLINMTKKEFESVWQTEKPRKEHQPKRIFLNAIKKKGDDVALTLNPFNFDAFEKKLFRKTSDGGNVFYQYELMMNELKQKNSFGTALNYKMSLKSLKNFIIYDKNLPEETVIKDLAFTEITPDWLSDYENYMLVEMKRSRTTVSMYLRALRTIFNNAITEKEIPSEIYPFCRDERERKTKYLIPSGENVKKALDKEQLKKLFKAKPQTEEQKKAKDFWFFSYACNGMNIKDIALLCWKDIDLVAGTLTFYRAKTIRTTRKPKRITVFLNDFSKSVIEKYSNKSKDKSDLVFPFIADNESEFENFRRIKNFTRFVNQNIKTFAESIGLSDSISTYWARHSFSTTAIRNGKSMEFVSESLGHSETKTTQTYFAGFTDETKKEFADSLMNF